MQFALYYTEGCPYCQRVLKPVRTHQWPVDLRNVAHNIQDSQDLIEGGGRSTVPCLRITDDQGKVIWMYESLDILALLQRHFA